MFPLQRLLLLYDRFLAYPLVYVVFDVRSDNIIYLFDGYLGTYLKGRYPYSIASAIFLDYYRRIIRDDVRDGNVPTPFSPLLTLDLHREITYQPIPKGVRILFLKTY